MDMKQRISDLIVITTRLSEVLGYENKALQEHKIAELARYLEDKATLSRAYESRMLGVMKNPDELNEVDPDLRERLHSLGEKVRDLMEENARLLKSAMAAHKKFVSIVADAVKTASNGPTLYAPSGSKKRQKVRTLHRPRALSLDQTL